MQFASLGRYTQLQNKTGKSDPISLAWGIVKTYLFKNLIDFRKSDSSSTVISPKVIIIIYITHLLLLTGL